VRKLNDSGTKFRRPPPTYYTLEGKISEIEALEEDPNIFKELGILVDPEYTETEKNFLLQIFSFPVFNVNTFFMEIIQRRGSRGFGAGNIRALAQSIIEYKKEFAERVNKTKHQLTRVPPRQLLRTQSSNLMMQETIKKHVRKRNTESSLNILQIRAALENMR